MAISFGPVRQMPDIKLSASPAIKPPQQPYYVNPAVSNLPSKENRFTARTTDTPLEGFKRNLLVRTGDPTKNPEYSKSGVIISGIDETTNEYYEEFGGENGLYSRFVNNQNPPLVVPVPYTPSTADFIMDSNDNDITDQNGQPLFSALT